MRKATKKAVRRRGCKEAIHSVNGIRSRRESKQMMEAKTALTPLTSAVGDKSEVSSGGSWHHQRYLPSKVLENPGPPKNNLMASF